ncbi:hypothetical protein MRX96_051020 [Rhipicephalus microplus]
MKEMRPSTADVVLKYPALAKAEMLHEEFIALTGVNLEKKVLEFINRYGDRCFELAKCRRCAKEAVKAIEEEVEALDGDEKKYRFAVGIVELLPMLLKEQPRFLQGPDTYPALSLKGKNASEATNIVASFEGLSVEVLDVIAGRKSAPDGVAKNVNHPIVDSAHQYVAWPQRWWLDHNYQFFDIVAGWPGSFHDSMIFENSHLRVLYEENRVPRVLLGDAGYACQPYLFSPFSEPGPIDTPMGRLVHVSVHGPRKSQHGFVV